MSISKKHVFFIEGGDNVGKSTTIETFKDTTIIDDCRYNRVSFSKYPRHEVADTINVFMRELKEIEDKKDTMTRWKYDTSKKKQLDTIMKFMIDDMEYSFTNKDDTPYHINYPDDICNICDRGPLSTYLYQYRNLPGVPKIILGDKTEALYLREFFEKYIIPKNSENSMSIIILHNNANPLTADLLIDESETIEYKRQFDHDVALQTRINSSLNNIVGGIQNGTIDNIKGIKFYYINIFDETGSIRKSSYAICKEMLSIINKED